MSRKTEKFAFLPEESCSSSFFNDLSILSGDAIPDDTEDRPGVLVVVLTEVTEEVTLETLSGDTILAFEFLKRVSSAVGTHCDRRGLYHNSAPSCGNHQNQDLQHSCGYSHVKFEHLPHLFHVLHWLKLLSLDADSRVQNVLRSTDKPDVPSTVWQTIIAVVAIIKALPRMINGYIDHNILDHEDITNLATIQFAALTSLRDLAQTVKKICPDTCMAIIKMLQWAASYIGTIGRKLTLQELHKDAIALLSPLWPYPRMKELLPYMTHHEILCKSYLNTKEITKAWFVASEVIMLDISLVSEEMVRLLSDILVEHESLFRKVECLQRLNKSMEVLLTHWWFDDILALSTLLYWEAQSKAFSNGTVDSDTLMRKAAKCFEIWIHWFQSVGNEIIYIEGRPRVRLSLRFLTKFAELAIVNFQNAAAFKSLCEAYHLAQRMKQLDIAKDVARAIVTLIPQLGLQCEEDPAKGDVFMDSMGLGEDSNLPCLTAIASHHLKTGQLDKYLIVRDAVYCRLPFISEIDVESDDEIDKLARAVFHRLEAEFLIMPESKRLLQGKGCTEIMQDAFYPARASYGYLHKMSSKIGDGVLGSWRIIHEYLCTAKVTGELFMYTGYIDKARTCFLDGLRAADKFSLANWEVILTSKLIEIELLIGDDNGAVKMLKHAQDRLTYIVSAIEPGLLRCSGKPKIDLVSNNNLACGLNISNNNLACGLNMSNLKRKDTSCQHRSDFRQDMLSNLFGNLEPGRCNMNDHMLEMNNLILTDISTCCSCCQPEIIGVCIDVMCLQAEILWKKKKSICPVSSLLQCSLKMAHRLVRIPSTNLTDLMIESGLNICHSSQDIKSSNRNLAATAYKCAEIYFQNLCMRNVDAQIVCDHAVPGICKILLFLRLVEAVSEKTGGFHMVNEIRASALLLKSNLTYLQALKTLPQDVHEAEINPHPLSAMTEMIISALNVAMKKKMKWDERRSSQLSVKEDQNKEAVWESKENSQRYQSRQRHGEADCYNVQVGKEIKDRRVVIPVCVGCKTCGWCNRLTVHSPSLAAYPNVTRRISCLEAALQQFSVIPHSMLYRHISQSLALCLWEKQMDDVWNTNQACSTQVSVAVHLTDSMHMTFQHMMAENFCNKLRSEKFWPGFNQEEAQIDKQAMEEALNVLTFGGDVMENFKNRLASIPADWTVVQMTFVHFNASNPLRGHLFVTRLNNNQEPITVDVPSQSVQFFKDAWTLHEQSISLLKDKIIQNKDYHHFQELLLYLQEVILGGHKWLLRGQLNCVRQPSVQAFLDEEGRRAVNIILQKHGCHIIYTELRNVLEIVLGANEADILSLVESIWSPHITGTLTQMCMDIQVKVIRMCGDQWNGKRGPVVLILDNELTLFPWENMPDLILDTVTRMPSLTSLIAILTLHTKMARSPFRSGVDRTSVTANVPCVQDDLQDICESLVTELKQYKDWQIETKLINTSCKKLEAALKNSSLFLNFQHEWEDYRLLQSINSKAFAMAMNCRSGFLTGNVKLDGDGPSLYFLLAGCPAVMGHLWLAIASDLKTTTSNLISCWMAENKPSSMRELLVRHMHRVTGFGLVIYGLPIMMN